SRGFVCAKGTRFAEVAYHPSRLTRPMLRQDGVLVASDWATALARTGRAFRRIIDEHGPHAVAIYFGNPIAFNARASLVLPAFAEAIGTRNLFGAGSQDCNNKFAAARLIHGSEVVHPFPDFAGCDLAVIFGSNPLVSQSSFVHLEGGARVFDELVARGGDVIFVDPRRSESAERWGTHLPVRPGSDVWLLAALLARCGPDLAVQPAGVHGLEALCAAVKQISDEEVSQRTGLSVAAIDALAARIHRADRVALHLSVGVNMGGHGTLAVVLLQALAVATGNFDRDGGLLVHPYAAALARLYRLGGFERPKHSRIGGYRTTLGTLPAAILAEEIDTPGEGQIRGLLCISGDPVVSVPGGDRLAESLGRLEHLACIDLFESRTGELADVLFPATTWLERWDVATASMLFQRGGRLQASGPVIPPVGETRHDAAILGALAREMGLSPAWGLLERGIDRWLPRGRHGVPQPKLKPGRWLGRRDLRFWGEEIAAEMERLRAAPQPREGGFLLMGRRRRLGHNSWLHGAVRDGNGEAAAWLHPDDLAALELEAGQAVTIDTQVGSLILPTVARDDLARGTVVVPHGLAAHNVNALIPSDHDAVERVSGQLRMTGIEARITPLRTSRGVASGDHRAPRP
ncbi:MAG: molybdopterin-dependent oxidoreductase, partial [Myxococcales bacterium]|nr:molybdopterin-dependent oxidoreductase [Myxococcales bacterium]